MKRNLSKKYRAVFLDRDGVVVKEPPHYAHRIDQLRLVAGSAQAIRQLNFRDFLVIVISNQAGVARGYFKEEDTKRFNDEMVRRLKKQGAKIDAVYYCPHHPEGTVTQYRIACDCRKPAPGMIKTAAKELGINLRKSFIVGDKWSDIDAGKNAGCKGYLVRTGQGKEQSNKRSGEVAIAGNLGEAVKLIISK